MSELIPANIVIADRSYRLKIEPIEEELIRKTVKLINDKIFEYKENFAGKDMQDYVSMALLWFATEQNKTGESMIQLDETSKKLQAFEAQLNKVLEDIESTEA
ncbi:MAG TPA: cell division protein ZapA [Chitinophagaceae bacterium]|jgi:cell division protein ZapA|nr:cell division protein ZapA [Chitinophagaceae bacterium]MBP9739311.1 cell division protein ZapA [Chitinophagaceae bacterium]HPH24806.1 cell division protein ZapA [Chitinophagaceae bacterium]